MRTGTGTAEPSARGSRSSLTCRGKEMANEVAADPRFQRYLRSRLIPHHPMVDPDRHNELLDTPEAIGYWPHPGVAQKAGLEARARVHLRDQPDTLRELMAMPGRPASRT